MKRVLIWLLGIGLAASPALAQDEEEKVLGWSAVAELSVVTTSGNSETESFGLKNTAVKTMASSAFTLEAGALRAESTTFAAVGTPESFRPVSTSELTAESYHLRGRYDRDVSDTLLWFVGAGWDRNTFAGVDNRYYTLAGIGQVWFEDETTHFRTDYGVTFTRQEDVSGVEEDFAGLRLGWDYWRQLNASTEFASLLLLDGNLDETDDFRGDFTNWLAVSMSERLALRVTLQLLYDNLPSLGELALFDDAGLATGATVLDGLDDLDSILTVGLIVNF